MINYYTRSWKVLLEIVPKFLFGDATEVWIKNEKCFQIIGTDTYKGKVLFIIAADEAHTFPNW